MPGLISIRRRIDGGATTRFRGHQLLHALAPQVHRAPAVRRVRLPRRAPPRPHRHRLGGLPRGLHPGLEDMKRYGLPIWVTENGIDDRSGTRRSAFIRRHWAALLDARAEGVDVRAYLHWSAARQLRVARGLGPALRPLPRRLRDARAHGRRRPSTTSARSRWSASSGLRARSPCPCRRLPRSPPPARCWPAPSGPPARRRRSRTRLPRPRARGRRIQNPTGRAATRARGRPRGGRRPSPPSRSSHA